ncbi:MAG: TatD family nuclease-associated radical SAM protein [Candidatus Bathyarchaeia archaeon]
MQKGKGASTVYWLGNNLYLNTTNKCSNNCYFCIRNFRSGVGGFKLKLDKEPTLNEIICELQNVINMRNWDEVVFCGFGEPLERLDAIIQICKWIRRFYGKPVKIRVDTNGHGYIINAGRDIIKELLDAGVNRISVSLNAQDSETYKQVCRPKFEGAFESVLEFVRRARTAFDLEITAVTIPEVDVEKVREIAESLNVKFRLREYIPCSW